MRVAAWSRAVGVVTEGVTVPEPAAGRKPLPHDFPAPAGPLPLPGTRAPVSLAPPPVSSWSGAISNAPHDPENQETPS